MYAVYIMKSKKTGRYYTGHTDAVKRRMVEHNTGMSKYTRRDRPWKL
ncbi:MAG: GIY-YIG nuclease family protein, partial [Bacteroidetes bacterium]|nr:GIY-YIG nuclease family protein [Bacteroidota bacterium]